MCALAHREVAAHERHDPGEHLGSHDVLIAA